MGISSTEAEEMHTPSSPSKGKDGLSCEITRTYNPSVPGIADSHEFAIHLTTGTFNLLSKTKSAIRLSGAFSVEPQRIRTERPRNFWEGFREKTAPPSSAGGGLTLLDLHSLLRRLKANLSKVPQLFSMCQPAALIIRANVDFHDARDCMFRDDKSSLEKLLPKDLVRRFLRLAKPFRAGSHPFE